MKKINLYTQLFLGMNQSNYVQGLHYLNKGQSTLLRLLVVLPRIVQDIKGLH